MVSAPTGSIVEKMRKKISKFYLQGKVKFRNFSSKIEEARKISEFLSWGEGVGLEQLSESFS